MNDKFDELHLIYKMIGNYGFCTVKSLLEAYDNLQQELQRKDNIINELKKWAKAVQLTVLRSDNKPVYQHQDVLDKIKELEESK